MLTTFNLLGDSQFTIDSIGDNRELLFSKVDFRPTIEITNPTTISFDPLDVEIFVVGTFFGIDGIEDRFKITSVGASTATIVSTNNRPLTETGEYQALSFSSVYKLRDLLINYQFRKDLTPEDPNVSTFDFYNRLPTGYSPNLSGIPTTTISLEVEVSFKTPIKRNFTYHFSQEIEKYKQQIGKDAKYLCYMLCDSFIDDPVVLQELNETEYGQLLSTMFLYHSSPIRQVEILGKLVSGLDTTTNMADPGVNRVIDGLMESIDSVDFIPLVRIKMKEGLKLIKSFSRVIPYVEDFRRVGTQLLNLLRSQAFKFRDEPSLVVTTESKELLEKQIRYASRLLWLNNVSLSDLRNEEYVFQRYNAFEEFIDVFERLLNENRFVNSNLSETDYVDEILEDIVGERDVVGVGGSPYYSEIVPYIPMEEPRATVTQEEPKNFVMNDRYLLGLDQETGTSYVNLSFFNRFEFTEFPPFPVQPVGNYPRYPEELDSPELPNFQPVVTTDYLNVKPELCSRYPVLSPCSLVNEPITYSTYRRASSELGATLYVLPKFRGKLCGYTQSLICSEERNTNIDRPVPLI